jgi:hypothetical protein
MKKLLFLLLLMPALASAQLGIFTKYYTRTGIAREYVYKSIQRNIESEIRLSHDTLRVQVGGKDRMDAVYAFNANGKCIYEEIRFYCSHCVTKHMKDLFELEGYHWKKISDTRYLSSYYHQTELTIENVDSAGICRILRFKVPEIPKKEYNARYKAL